VGHTTETGAPCPHHVARVEDLVTPATLGAACFAALHDLASALQGVGAAIDELDFTVGTDPKLRPLVDAAMEANERATALFVAQRGMIRDPAKRVEKVELAALINRATHQAAHKPQIGTLAAGTVDVAIPVIAQVVAAMVDAAAAGAGAPTVTAAAAGDTVAITVVASAPAPAPASIGATLAICARSAEAHGGAVQCGEREGRAAYTLRLPFKRR
jgi:hypothetical protein